MISNEIRLSPDPPNYPVDLLAYWLAVSDAVKERLGHADITRVFARYLTGPSDARAEVLLAGDVDGVPVRIEMRDDGGGFFAMTLAEGVEAER